MFAFAQKLNEFFIFPEGIRYRNETKDLIWTNGMFNDNTMYTYVNHIVSNVNFIQIDKS